MQALKFIFLALMICPLSSHGQEEMTGTWKLTEQGGKPFTEGTMIKIYSGSHFMFAQYEKNGKLLMAGGGVYRVGKNVYTEVMDFFTVNPDQAGKPVEYTYVKSANRISIEAPMHGIILKETWEKMKDDK